MNLAFSPSGDKLAVATMDQFAAVWDLAAIRRTLAGMGLDWEETPPQALPTPVGPPPRVDFVGANLADDPAAMRAVERDRLGLALWANPFDAAAYFERGRLLLADNQWATAYVHFSAALALLPDRPGVRNARLATAVRLERWADALADADALTGHWPDKSGVQSSRALALFHLRRHAEAAEEFGRLIQQFPRDPELYVRRADCYDGMNRSADATADRRKAEELARPDRRR
jgi:tetratricopeptide (TPR) repeat protein